jgi:hypothetical protein
MAEQLLDEPDVGPAFQHRRGAGVAQQVIKGLSLYTLSNNLTLSSLPGNEGPPEARKHCFRRRARLSSAPGLDCRRTLLPGQGWQAKPVTTAGTKWSGWRGLCRGWGGRSSPPLGLRAKAIAAAFPSMRRSNTIRSM